MASGDTKTEALLRILGHGGSYDGISGSGNTKTQDLLVDAIGRIQNVEDDVEELKNNPDVVDIVDTYADLQAYDTSTLTDKDIIRVLEDSTHNNGSTYYRWNATTNQFDYIGEAGGGGPTVVQTTGTSTTDVMSQSAVTGMVFRDPSTKRTIRIGDGATVGATDEGVAIGRNSNATGSESVCVGKGAGLNTSTSHHIVAIGSGSGQNMSNISGTVSLGAFSKATRTGEVNVGSTSTTYGYNSTNYRVIGGVHDPIDAHDAATKGYVDANASTEIFYMSVTPYVARSGVSLYSDIALTTAVPASTFVQALRDCKSVFLVYKLGDLDWDARYIVQIIGSFVPNADTAQAYDETFPGGYYFDGNAGDRYMIHSATSNPDDTASFDIIRLT